MCLSKELGGCCRFQVLWWGCRARAALPYIHWEAQESLCSILPVSAQHQDNPCADTPRATGTSLPVPAPCARGCPASPSCRLLPHPTSGNGCLAGGTSAGGTWTTFPRGAEVLCASLTLQLCRCLSPPALHYQLDQFSSVSSEFDAINC